MKILSVLLFLLLFTDVDAKVKETHSDIHAGLLYKEWIGPIDEYLKITQDSITLSTPATYLKSIYHVAGSVLLVPHTMYSSRNSPYDYNDSFSIVTLNADTLVLLAVNQSATESFKKHPFEKNFNPGPVTFVNRRRLIDPGFSFQKIVFASGGGMAVGACHRVQIRVDSSGIMWFSCAKASGKYDGTYKGQLSEAQLRQLKELIVNSIPQRFTDIPDHAMDAGSRSMRVWYNNTMSEAAGRGVPSISNDLQLFLDNLPGQVQLTHVSAAFGAEQ